MRRNERHRVMQRDKEIRGTKGHAGTPKDPNKAEANRLKQARLMVEAETRRDAKQRKAVPDMLSALRSAEKYFTILSADNQIAEDGLEVVRAAITKAEVR